MAGQDFRHDPTADGSHMGTDIHAFIEYESRPGGLREFSRDQLVLPPDYTLFHALGQWPESDARPLFPPRGLPDLISSAVAPAYYTSIYEDADARVRPPPLGRYHLLRSEVESNPVYRRWDYRGGPAGPRQQVADPDWHTPSWLTYRAVLAALAHLGLSVADQSPAFRAAVAAMAELTCEAGPDGVRLVFWFDN